MAFEFRSPDPKYRYTLCVTDAAIQHWKKICPELDLPTELAEQPWERLHDRPEDRSQGCYWLLPCGVVAVVGRVQTLSPKGRVVGHRSKLIAFLKRKKYQEGRDLPQPKVRTLSEEEYRKICRLKEKRKRKRRAAKKAAAAQQAPPS